MARVSRPAQGNNSSKPLNRPRPAYRADAAPVKVSIGTVSKPIPNRWGRLKRLVTDATPRVVKL